MSSSSFPFSRFWCLQILQNSFTYSFILFSLASATSNKGNYVFYFREGYNHLKSNLLKNIMTWKIQNYKIMVLNMLNSHNLRFPEERFFRFFFNMEVLGYVPIDFLSIHNILFLPFLFLLSNYFHNLETNYLCLHHIDIFLMHEKSHIWCKTLGYIIISFLQT